MIILHQPPGFWGVSSLSPFCTKLEAWLRLAQLPFESRAADMRKAPKGKVPFVTLDDGRLMGDSQLIIDHLTEVHSVKLDTHLTEQQVAIGHALRRMFEEATYFTSVYSRWYDDDGWEQLRPAFASIMPAPIRLVLPILRRRVKASLRSQGTARHSADEVYAVGLKDLRVASQLLADQPFLFGDQPTSFDCTMFAFVGAVGAFPQPSPMQRYVRADTRLVDYCRRFAKRVWGEDDPGPKLS